MKTRRFKAFYAMFLGLITLQAQDFNPKSSAAIHQSIQQLNFLGNVLYIAAIQMTKTPGSSPICLTTVTPLLLISL
jgi:hypothetical protein